MHEKIPELFSSIKKSKFIFLTIIFLLILLLIISKITNSYIVKEIVLTGYNSLFGAFIAIFSIELYNAKLNKLIIPIVLVLLLIGFLLKFLI